MYNQYKKILTKLTAILVAVSLILGILPAHNAYGFTQPATRNLEIEDVDSGNSSQNSYTVQLKWNLWSETAELIDPNTDYPVEPARTGMLVREKRMVSGTVATDHVIKTANAYRETKSTINLEGAIRGSLYSFKIYPYHQHKTVVTINGVLSEGPPVNIYPPESAIEEVLYMTNIKVDALGSVNADGENCLTVTWDNPTYNNTTVIPNYRIYFTPVTDGANVNDIETWHNLLVPMGDTLPRTDTIDTTIRRLEYTFSSRFLEQGKKYVVAVEPCNMAGEPFRMQEPKRMVNVNGKQTQIEFKQIGKGLYKSPEVGIPFTLNLDVYSDSYLRLTWPQVEASNAKFILISSSTDGKVWTEITKIYDKNRTSYLVSKPKSGITYYKVGFYKDEADILKGVIPVPETSTPYPSYNASGMDITPSRPELNLDLASTSTDNRIVVDATWGAFVRAPLTYEEESRSIGGKYIDTEVSYDIWLTDDLNSLLYAFETVPKIFDNGSFALNEQNYTYTTPLDKYYDTTTGKLESIVSNKLYYARIVARRPAATPLNGLKERWSEPGYATFYITARGQIATPPMISKPPLAVAKNADGEKLVTKTSITFTWREQWIELFDNDTSKPVDERLWYTSPIGKSGSRIVFGEAAEQAGVTPIDLSIYRNLEGVYTDLSSQVTSDIIAREMDLTGSKYEYKQYAYNDVSDKVGTKGDYEAFVNDVTSKEPAGTWTQIDTNNKDENGYPVFSITGTPNTTYVVLFRAYRDVPPTGLKVAFPTYIIEATLPEGTDVIIKPTVPKLVLVSGSITDVSAKVKWESSKLLRYELAYSDVYADPEKGIKISVDDVIKNSETKTETNVDFLHLPIDGLFPDTVYNVWIRAVTLDGKQKSSWSNQLTIKTNEMPVPSAPRGLGAASTSDLDLVNANQGTKYERVSKDYIIVTWLKNDKDKADNTAGATVEPNTARIEDDSLTDIFLAQFSSLIPNKEYYVKAKTIATVTPIDGGKANKTYSYVVQASVTPEFEEYVQITVPVTVPNPDSTGATRYYKQKESVWSTTVRIKTNTTLDEYDGASDEAFYPLQNEDYETVYDPVTNSVTFRFRVDGTDSMGNHDNRLDQRFISSLATSKIYSYNLDLSQNNYNSKIVELPYSIIKALDERKIDLKIKPTSTTIVTIPYGAIAGSSVKSMQGLSDTTKVTITVANNAAAPSPKTNESYVVPPYKLSVKAVSPKQTVNLTDTLKPMTLEMKSSSIPGTYEKNTGIYMTPSVDDAWQRINAEYDATSSQYKASASKLGTYSLIAASTPVVSGSNSDEIDAVYQMSSKLTISDSSAINTNEAVTGNVYNNILLSVLENKATVDVNSSVSKSDLQKLQKAGLSVSADADTEVTREEAIAALVTLYEKKSGSRIKYFYTADESPYADITDASPSYQTALLKAAEIGFFTNESFMSPASSLTYGELMYMINIINNNSK